MLGNSFDVVALAWGREYIEAARQLKASCQAYGINVYVCEIKGWPASRKDAWARRPSMMMASMELTGRPVLMLDADAVLKRDPRPHLAEAFLYDLAAYQHAPGIYYAGTIFARPTDKAFETLTLWRERMNDGDQAWEMDSVEFNQAVAESSPRIHSLPPEMCWVDRIMRPMYGPRKPVVDQLSIGSHV